MNKKVSIMFENAPGATPTKAEIEVDIVELPEFSELADGVYQVTIVDGVPTWSVNPLPALPSANGDYKLVVLEGVYTWALIV
jgi:hypothetical protein